MDDFKIGGKITLSENEQYIIIDIIEYEDKKYYFCSTAIKPVLPVVFEKENFEGKTFVKEVKDINIIKHITAKILGE